MIANLEAVFAVRTVATFIMLVAPTWRSMAPMTSLTEIRMTMMSRSSLVITEARS